MKLKVFTLLLFTLFAIDVSAAKKLAKKSARPMALKLVKKPVAAKSNVKKGRLPASAPRVKSRPAAPGRAPSSLGPALMGGGSLNASKALEIRGQARTLSMMLILRNNRENINFVKVRENYQSEIAKTEF
jgi:hypothetical protein